MQKPFTNDIGFIGYLLKRDHKITATDDTIWRIICRSAGHERSKAEALIGVIANGPVELAQLADAVRKEANSELQSPDVEAARIRCQRNAVNSSWQASESAWQAARIVQDKQAKFGNVEKIIAVFSMGVAVGSVVCFVASHWS